MPTFETQVIGRKNTRPDAEDWFPQDAPHALAAAERTADRLDGEMDVFDSGRRIYVLVRDKKSVVKKFEVFKRFEAHSL